MSDRFIANPNDVVKVHQKVEVTVMEVDVARKRISLSMKTGEARPPKSKKPEKSADKAKIFNKPFNAKPKPAHKPEQKGKAQPEGDLQLKLEALKNRFK